MKKKAREGYKMTELGEIPNEWEIKKLGDVANKNDKYSLTGGPFGSDLKSEHYTEDGVRVIQLQNIGDGYFNNEYKIYTSIDKANELSKCNVYPGDLIIAKMAEPVARACEIPNFERRFLMCSDGIRLDVSDENDSKYILYSINSEYFRKSAIASSTGSTRLRIGLSELKNLKILIAPKKEQEKIASILSTVDEQIDNTEKLIQKNQELKKGLMQNLLTKGMGHIKFKKTESGEVPEEWDVIKFDEIIDFLTDYEANGSFSGIKENVNIFDEPNYAYFVRATDLEKGDYINSVKYVDKKSYEFLAKTKLSGGEVLIAKRGQIGKVYIMPNLNKLCTLAPNLYLIKLDNKRVSNKFIYYYFMSSIGQKSLISNSASTTLGAIYKDDVKKITINLPILEEQEKITSILSKVDKKIEEYEVKKQKLEELKKGLMQQLLSGKIRVINLKGEN